MIYFQSYQAGLLERMQSKNSDQIKMTKEYTVKNVIFDTDMGTDDAWALQMILKAEKNLKNLKVLAITLVNGNTTVDHALRNTYRMLDGLDRTDVSHCSFSIVSSHYEII